MWHVTFAQPLTWLHSQLPRTSRETRPRELMHFRNLGKGFVKPPCLAALEAAFVSIKGQFSGTKEGTN